MYWLGRASKGLLLLAGVLGIVAVCIVASNPGCEDVVDQHIRPIKPTRPSKDPLEVFRRPWDSEAAVDWPVAERLAQMSSDAYLPPAEASAAFKRLGFLSTTSIVDGSMVSYVVTGRDVVVIVFRGTDDEPDWIVNLDSIPTNTPDGRIHEGFYDAYQTLRNEVVRAVRSGRPKYVWITGHSLGGALAVVCAYKCLADDQIDVTGLVTFGQPMVTMGKLADYFNTRLLGRYVHFVNESDLVPRVPPFFSHCGSLVWFKDGGIKRSKPKRTYGSGKATRPNRLNNSDEIPPMSELEFRELKRRLRVKSLRKGKPVYEGSMLWFGDHSMDCYLEKLHKIIGPG